MKNDTSFKLVAAIILAGVIIAFASPNHSTTAAPAAPAVSTPVVQTAQATE